MVAEVVMTDAFALLFRPLHFPVASLLITSEFIPISARTTNVSKTRPESTLRSGIFATDTYLEIKMQLGIGGRIPCHLARN
jgi:hypothetical protein